MRTCPITPQSLLRTVGAGLPEAARPVKVQFALTVVGEALHLPAQRQRRIGLNRKEIVVRVISRDRFQIDEKSAGCL
jgi:hypothetical protein